VGQPGTEVLLKPPFGRIEQPLTKILLRKEWVQYRPLAWSPDSQYLVVADARGGRATSALYLVSLESKSRRQLTSPPLGADDGFPAFSPDGRILAFARLTSNQEGNIFLLELTEEMEPAGEPTQLTHEAGLSKYPTWTRDGREIIFAHGTQLHASLYRIPVSGAGPPQKLPFGDGAWHPAFSQQGNRLAFERGVADSDVYRVTHPDRVDAPADYEDLTAEILISSSRADNHGVYSPDGSRIAFRSERSGRPEIWVSNSDGTLPIQLTNYDGADVRSPSWSPQNDRICFASGESGTYDISVIDAAGGRGKRLTTDRANDLAPSWSRDSQWIYFHSDRAGGEQIWKIPSEGGEPVQVTTKGGSHAFELSDGRYICYERDGALYRAPVDGGEETKLLEAVETVGNTSQAVGTAAYATQAERIYFLSRLDESGDRSLCFIDLNTGSVITVVLRFPDALVSISPDARWLLFSEGGNLVFDLMLVENFR
jgi:Tol biopolymer transport system component